MLKVLWLSPFPLDSLREKSSYRGHPAAWVTELAREIAKKAELTIATWAKKANGVEDFKKNGIRYIFLQKPRLRYDFLSLYRSRIDRLANYIKKCGSVFDVVHVHGTEGQYEVVAQRLGIPYVISIQGLINLCRPLLPEKFSGVYASWVLRSLYERSGIKRGKYFFCRTVLDTGYVQHLNPNANIFLNWEIIRKEFFDDNFNEKSKNLLFMGGTNNIKGFRETLRCIDVLKKTGFDMRLRICGGGDVENVARFLRADNLTISLRDIDFLGYQSAEQLVNLFKDSFCMIHPSYMDNSPNSICEAQVSGLPVVASGVGGVGSLIEDGSTGLLVKRYDHIGLADQTCRLLNDRDLYRTISEMSRAVARKRHNRAVIVENTLNAYYNLIGR